ncbi:MAG: hypothetical protein Q9159_003870 [Coniocarpon cinnabarinum]
MPLYFNKKDMGKPKVTPEEKFPELFAVNRKIDRRQALTYLTLHRSMFSTLIDPCDNDMWLDAINGKFFGGRPFSKTEWDQLLGHCQAVSDFPACAFAPELIKAYPDAKVILTNRPVDAWYKSCIGTIRRSMTSPLLYFIGFFDTEVLGKWTPMTRALFKAVFDDDFEKNGKQVYVDQYETVRSLVPKDQLFEYQIGEGWDRLCDFLEVDKPPYPYPVTNEGAAFQERNRLRLQLALQRGLPNILMTASAVAAGIAIGSKMVGWW